MSTVRGQWDIYSMNTNGSDQRRLTQTGNLQSPDWSPDGATIAFRSDFAPGGLYLMNANGTNQRQIAASPYFIRGPHWSPDGKYLLFVVGSTPAQPEAGVWAYGPMNVQGKVPGLVQVLSATDGYDNLSTTSWSPDLDPSPGYQGKILVPVITSATGLPSGAHLIGANIALDGTFTWSVPAQPVVLTNYNHGVTLASTPYGLRMAAEIGVGGTYNAIGVAGVTYEPASDTLAVATGYYLITPNGTLTQSPDWSADGTRIAYVSFPSAAQPGNSPEIYTIEVPEGYVGRTPVRLTNNRVTDGSPSWSPPVF